MAIKITRNVGRPTAAEEALVLWGVRVAEEMQAEQIAKDFVATGRSLKSYEVVVLKSGIVDLFWAEYLSTSLEGVGRKPGSLPPISAIENWIRVKGIKPERGSINQLAWAISKRMQAEGNQVYRGARSGIDLIDILNNSFDSVKNSMALLVAQEASNFLVKQYGNNTKKAK